MGMDLYVKFKRPLTADELSAWSGVSTFSDYDLERAQFLFSIWISLCSQDYITVTSLISRFKPPMQRRIIANKIREIHGKDSLSDKQINWLTNQVWFRYMANLRDGLVWYRRGEAILEVAGVAWDECANGPYPFLFNRFFGDYDWTCATIGRRWWINQIFNNVDDEHKEEWEGNTYLVPCGSLDHDKSIQFCKDNIQKLNGNGIFPAELVETFYWG